MEAHFDEREKDCLLINEKSPFFTIMIEEAFLEVLVKCGSLCMLVSST